jgi:hypothetical protein
MTDSNEGVIRMAAPDVTAGRVFRQGCPRAAALMALMVVGSVALWTVIPIAGLWVASQLNDSATQVEVLPWLVALAGIPTAMVFAGALLARAERHYLRITGTTAPQERVAPAWRRSLGDSRTGMRLTVLDRVMVASAFMALIAIAVWFFGFAGSSLPV